jgi:hypothetical protein
LDATIKAFSSNPAAAGQVGETFASVRPGINYIVNGGNGIDTVYVADGSKVDATVLGQSVDLIYMRGKWSDYTKSLETNDTVLLFTRQVNGVTESVKVDAGTSRNFDRLIFADGSVTTFNAKTAITSDPNVGLEGVAAYNPKQTTPLYSDAEVAAALAATSGRGREEQRHGRHTSTAGLQDCGCHRRHSRQPGLHQQRTRQWLGGRCPCRHSARSTGHRERLQRHPGQR